MQKTDVNGALQEAYAYASFGDTYRNPNVFWGFSSEKIESEQGLIYYNYRYYPPKLGKWLSRDSIEENGGLNLSEFCSNNPSNFYDNLGKEIPALDSVSANPSISLEMYYDVLEQTFNMSRQQILRRAAHCKTIHTAYKSLNCSGCSLFCIPKSIAQKNAQCLSLEVAGRATYLGLKCDYFLAGSIRRGTAVAVQGHSLELQEKTAALAKCASKAF